MAPHAPPLPPQVARALLDALDATVADRSLRSRARALDAILPSAAAMTELLSAALARLPSSSSAIAARDDLSRHLHHHLSRGAARRSSDAIARSWLCAASR